MPAVPAWVRLVVVAAAAAMSIAAFRDGQTTTAAVALAVAVLMGLAWLRYHDVRRAERAFRDRDHERAWEILETVPFRGRLLARPIRLWYHHARALCLEKEEKWAPAAEEAAAAARIAGENVEGAKCHLIAARCLVHAGDLPAARSHAERARQLPHSEFVDQGLARIAWLLREEKAP